jgi:nucleoside phosphorylase
MDLALLRQTMTTHFSDSELRDLCFDLGIDDENLPGQGKGAKARELITYCMRHQRIPELIARLSQLRPHVDWTNRGQVTTDPPGPAAQPSTLSTPRPHVDIGIVIALEEEFRELAPQIDIKPEYNADIREYFYRFERNRANATRAPYQCVVTFMNRMGPTDAGIVGERLIAQYNPTTIVNIGIAGSMDQNVLVGDVVVADQIDGYLESSKATETGNTQGWEFQLSGDTYKSDPEYVTHATHLKYAHAEPFRRWEHLSRQRLSEWLDATSVKDLKDQHLIGAVSGLHTGHIASGPIVGATHTFVQWLKERDRKFLALEMESVGVLNAAHKRGVRSLIIRGVSDYSDARKAMLDELGKGALRRYAMNNAIGLLWVLMDSGLI